MSLLEDVFLQDEANEAEELERVIEGDEFEERRRSDSDENSEKEDEAEEDKRRVDPTKAKTTRVIKNPRFLLNPARLTGPRGIQVLPEHFKDFKFKGKGYEKEDLDLVLKKLEHWAYRLYPKFQFEDCLKKIEMLGKKRPVAVHLHKIRSDQFLSEDTVEQKDSSDEDNSMPVQEEDEFDKLLQQQIDLARSTPAPDSANKHVYDHSTSPKDKRTGSLMMPKATSSPSINDEQRERMLRSRRLAEERRLARLKNAVNASNSGVSVENSERNTENDEINKDTKVMSVVKKHNRSNVIDSSDEESMPDTSMSVAVDVHTDNRITDENENKKKPGDNHPVTEATIEIENIIESREFNIYNSELDISTGNETIAGLKEKIVKNDDIGNISCDNSIKDHVNKNIDNIINEKSNEDEEESCNESDVNINLNVGNICADNNSGTVNKEIHCELSENVLNDIDDITKGSYEEALNSIAGPSNVITGTSESIPIDILQDVTDEVHDTTKVMPGEVIEDIMDVDFTDDF